MRNFQGTFETHKRSFISAFSICVTVTSNVCLVKCVGYNLTKQPDYGKLIKSVVNIPLLADRSAELGFS